MYKLRNQRGFTLIELLVTISLIGIISVPLMGLLASSMQNNVHSKSKTSNGAIAQGFMEQFKKTNSILNLFEGNDTTSLYILYRDGDDIYLDLSDYPMSGGINRYYVNTSNNTETYGDILNKFSDKEYGDYVVKVVLSKERELSTGLYTGVMHINIVVWDKLNKDSSKISLVSLRSY